jgi:heme exporter protein A
MTLAAHDLSYARGTRRLFSDLNFSIAPSEALWLAGENGAGKTSLLRLLCGLASPISGEVRWNGEDIASLREDFYQHVIFCGHASGTKDDLTAWENIAFTSTIFGQSCSRNQAYAALDRMQLAHIGHLPARVLSQGQRKRVALARLCLQSLPRLLILDEPFTALDKASVELLTEVLNQHLRNEGIVVYTTHQDLALQARQLHVLNLREHAAANLTASEAA